MILMNSNNCLQLHLLSVCSICHGWHKNTSSWNTCVFTDFLLMLSLTSKGLFILPSIICIFKEIYLSKDIEKHRFDLTTFQLKALIWCLSKSWYQLKLIIFREQNKRIKTMPIYLSFQKWKTQNEMADHAEKKS